MYDVKTLIYFYWNFCAVFVAIRSIYEIKKLSKISWFTSTRRPLVPESRFTITRNENQSQLMYCRSVFRLLEVHKHLTVARPDSIEVINSGRYPSN